MRGQVAKRGAVGAVVAQRGAAVLAVVDYVVLTLIVLVFISERLQHWRGHVRFSRRGNEFQLYQQRAEYLCET